MSIFGGPGTRFADTASRQPGPGPGAYMPSPIRATGSHVMHPDTVEFHSDDVPASAPYDSSPLSLPRMAWLRGSLSRGTAAYDSPGPMYNTRGADSGAFLSAEDDPDGVASNRRLPMKIGTGPRMGQTNRYITKGHEKMSLGHASPGPAYATEVAEANTKPRSPRAALGPRRSSTERPVPNAHATWGTASLTKSGLATVSDMYSPVGPALIDSAASAAADRRTRPQGPRATIGRSKRPTAAGDGDPGPGPAYCTRPKLNAGSSRFGPRPSPHTAQYGQKPLTIAEQAVADAPGPGAYTVPTTMKAVNQHHKKTFGPPKEKKPVARLYEDILRSAGVLYQERADDMDASRSSATTRNSASASARLRSPGGRRHRPRGTPAGGTGRRGSHGSHASSAAASMSQKQSDASKLRAALSSIQRIATAQLPPDVAVLLAEPDTDDEEADATQHPASPPRRSSSRQLQKAPAIGPRKLAFVQGILHSALGVGSWYVLFKAIDEDHSGNISFDELVLAVRERLAVLPDDVSADDLAGLWKLMDADGSGVLTVKEFAEFMRQGREASHRKKGAGGSSPRRMHALMSKE